MVTVEPCDSNDRLTVAFCERSSSCWESLTK